MDEGKVAVRYSKALLSLAKEQGVISSVIVDVKTLEQLLDTFPRLNEVLVSPVVSTEEKHKLFKQVFEPSFNPLTYGFLNLLLTNKREAYLKRITRCFMESYRKEEGFKAAKLTSVIELDKATLEKFSTLIQKHFNTKVDLTVAIDKSLIGGFILDIEDQRIDASIASKFRRLKRELLESQS
ncbi:MAG: ATP synthase F1 subunit delta [Bacteroidia bacterium]|nr:ATP synthase F1 subunit delta [Bacteroidia bacterium]